jgi:hypothetical protein
MDKQGFYGNFAGGWVQFWGTVGVALPSFPVVFELRGIFSGVACVFAGVTG